MLELAPKNTQSDSAAKPVEVILLTVIQAAAALQVSQRTIFNLIDRGELDTIRIGKSLRIHSDTLQAFARRGTRKPNYEGKLIESLSPAGIVQAQ
jgi:excisionase family DNA binding protein